MARDESSDPTPSGASRVQKEWSRHKFIGRPSGVDKGGRGRHVEKRLSGVLRRDEPDTMPMRAAMIPRTLLRSTHSLSVSTLRASELYGQWHAGDPEGIHGRRRRDATSGALHLGRRMWEAKPLTL